MVILSFGTGIAALNILQRKILCSRALLLTCTSLRTPASCAQRYDFMTRERELRALDDATPDGLRAWFQRYVAQGASHRWGRGGQADMFGVDAGPNTHPGGPRWSLIRVRDSSGANKSVDGRHGVTSLMSLPAICLWLH